MTAPPIPAVTVDALLAAVLPAPYGYVFRSPGNRLARLRNALRKGPGAVEMPCLAFVLRHPTAGVILVDTGLHPDTVRRGPADLGFPMRVVFGKMQPESPAFDRQLRDHGVEPDEVEHVVMTHLHADHTGGMRLLPNATFVTTVDEWTASQRRFGSTRGFLRSHLPPASRVRRLDPQRDGEPYGPFARTIDLLGDGSVRLLSTPGHSPGHLSVLLEVAGRGPVLLVGDAAYTRRSIDEQILPMLTDDDAVASETLGALHRFSVEHPDAIIVPTHDPEAWKALAESPVHH